jgi:hypothetical protein
LLTVIQPRQAIFGAIKGWKEELVVVAVWVTASPVVEAPGFSVASNFYD